MVEKIINVDESFLDVNMSWECEIPASHGDEYEYGILGYGAE
jgi:hypothetical protein